MTDAKYGRGRISNFKTYRRKSNHVWSYDGHWNYRNGTTEIAAVKLRRQFLGMERMCKHLKMQKETSVQE